MEQCLSFPGMLPAKKKSARGKGLYPLLSPDGNKILFIGESWHWSDEELLEGWVSLGYYLCLSDMDGMYIDDIIFLASNNSFSSGKVRQAIDATFQKRETDIGRRLFIYQDQYSESKSVLWRLFLRCT